METKWKERNLSPTDLFPFMYSQPLSSELSALQVPLGWREYFPSDGPFCDAVAVSAAAAENWDDDDFADVMDAESARWGVDVSIHLLINKLLFPHLINVYSIWFQLNPF